MWEIQKRTEENGEWKHVYSSWSQAKTKRQFLKYKTILKNGQSLRIMYGNEEIDKYPTTNTD